MVLTFFLAFMTTLCLREEADTGLDLKLLLFCTKVLGWKAEATVRQPT